MENVTEVLLFCEGHEVVKCTPEDWGDLVHSHQGEKLGRAVQTEEAAQRLSGYEQTSWRVEELQSVRMNIKT